MVGNYRRNKTEFRPGHLLGLSFNVIRNESFPQSILTNFFFLPLLSPFLSSFFVHVFLLVFLGVF